MLFLLILLHSLLPFRAHSTAKSTFTVEVSNIRQLTGRVYIGLFRPCEGFPSNCSAVENKALAADSKNISATFMVEPGDYAIALYHDVNGNGKMDFKLIGLPKEPYGFSNNYRPIVSGPSFADCKVQVGTSGKQISIKLL